MKLHEKLRKAKPIGIDLKNPKNINIENEVIIRLYESAKLNEKPLEGILEKILFSTKIDLIDQWMKNDMASGNLLNLTYFTINSEDYVCPLIIPGYLIGKEISLKLIRYKEYSSPWNVKGFDECLLKVKGNEKNSGMILSSGPQYFRGGYRSSCISDEIDQF